MEILNIKFRLVMPLWREEQKGVGCSEKAGQLVSAVSLNSLPFPTLLSAWKGRPVWTASMGSPCSLASGWVQTMGKPAGDREREYSRGFLSVKSLQTMSLDQGSLLLPKWPILLDYSLDSRPLSLSYPFGPKGGNSLVATSSKFLYYPLQFSYTHTFLNSPFPIKLSWNDPILSVS